MAKVYVVIVTQTRTRLGGNYKHIDKVFKTLEAARDRIEQFKDEFRSDEDITILGESWKSGEYPYYYVSCIENYYLQHNMMDYDTFIEYNIEEHELAD